MMLAFMARQCWSVASRNFPIGYAEHDASRALTAPPEIATHIRIELMSRDNMSMPRILIFRAGARCRGHIVTIFRHERVYTSIRQHAIDADEVRHIIAFQQAYQKMPLATRRHASNSMVMPCRQSRAASNTKVQYCRAVISSLVMMRAGDRYSGIAHTSNTWEKLAARRLMCYCYIMRRYTGVEADDSRYTTR